MCNKTQDHKEGRKVGTKVNPRVKNGGIKSEKNVGVALGGVDRRKSGGRGFRGGN